MSNVSDGGPVFPVTASSKSGGVTLTIPTNGMSLRDWFAGQAIPVLLERYLDRGVKASPAVAAYEVADAMLAERAKETA